jgi:uncharacterized membrane protein YccC
MITVWVEMIKNLLLALTAYLNLKAKTFYTDLHEKSHKKQDELVNQIQGLTANPNPANIALVNRLQLQLQQERERLTDLSAYCPKSSTKSNS